MICAYVLELTKCAIQNATINFSFFTLPGKPEKARSGLAKGSQYSAAASPLAPWL
jgi:hypothetical protein